MTVIGSRAARTVARLLRQARRNVEYFQSRLRVLAIIAIIAFPLYYYIWHSLFPQRYENLALRLIGATLFIPILFTHRWPQRLKPYLPHYWYFSLLYALPFFFTFMLLKNNGSDVWIGSALVAIFLMIVLLDWFSLIAHLVLGCGLAVLAIFLSGDASLVTFGRYDFVAIALFAVAIGTVSNHGSRIELERERAMLATAGSIAHELRTPLLGIRAGASGLARYLPVLIESYQLAQRHGLAVTAIRAAHLDALKGVLERIDAEAYHSNAIIDMLLVNARVTGAVEHERVRCSMAHCVEVALRRYPFSDDERALVSWQRGADFEFRGAELLMVHVLFNLIKNALRHIGQAGHGKITIGIQTSPDGNRLTVHDTSGGIAPRTLPHIFRRFYTSAGDGVLGAGIGLAFCRDVMGSFGGTIACKSIYGESSEFVLRFPPP